MALRPSLGFQQRQRLGLTQEIKSSLQYLALAGLRLEQTLQDVVESNPFLNVSATHAAHEDQDWIANLVDPGPDSVATALRHVAKDLFWRAEDRALANVLIDATSESGLLIHPLTEIERPNSVSLQSLKFIQAAFLQEGGLLADDLGQCFIAQLRMKAEAGDLDPDLLPDLIHMCENLPALRDGRLSPNPEHLNILQTLNPRPADRLDVAATVILPPDLIAERAGGGWAVRLNTLTHRAYDVDQDMLAALSPAAQKRPEIAAPLKAARATVRALQARSQTLINLTALLCDQQSAALDSDRSALKPLTQGEVADALNLHGSTISRAVAGKAVQTPNGVWALKDFFTALIDPATQFSGVQLRVWLAQAIAEESHTKPKSDDRLAKDLGLKGPKVARRTITKYRLRLGVPGAAVRRRTYAQLRPKAKPLPPTERKSYEIDN